MAICYFMYVVCVHGFAQGCLMLAVCSPIDLILSSAAKHHHYYSNPPAFIVANKQMNQHRPDFFLQTIIYTE